MNKIKETSTSWNNWRRLLELCESWTCHSWSPVSCPHCTQLFNRKLVGRTRWRATQGVPTKLEDFLVWEPRRLGQQQDGEDFELKHWYVLFLFLENEVLAVSCLGCQHQAWHPPPIPQSVFTTAIRQEITEHCWGAPAHRHSKNVSLQSCSFQTCCDVF